MRAGFSFGALIHTELLEQVQSGVTKLVKGPENRAGEEQTRLI